MQSYNDGGNLHIHGKVYAMIRDLLKSSNLLIGDNSSYVTIYVYFLLMKIMIVLMMIGWSGHMSMPQTLSTMTFDGETRPNSSLPSAKPIKSDENPAKSFTKKQDL
ncbi:unnamed protein product [Angiostrongylus costaricensis]|uniref:Uncharacterized protein n=1 Tax=Angiostrongylus costaricensis TaxID=334426 RepID=A0A0R3P9L3_ANGCS|nr:unnamed protein product [Angiostrongylus costaricensis]